MTAGDTDALDDLLDDDFTLSHITGYVQPKAEWLAQMPAGQFIYHAVQHKSATVDGTNMRVRLVGRIVTDATVYGTRATWRLKLTMDYIRAGDDRIALNAVAATLW